MMHNGTYKRPNSGIHTRCPRSGVWIGVNTLCDNCYNAYSHEVIDPRRIGCNGKLNKEQTCQICGQHIRQGDECGIVPLNNETPVAKFMFWASLLMQMGLAKDVIGDFYE